ncbi:ABC transporter [Burkholderia ubonensis]|uniref:ABC transporter n=1 Tax=Burkholderia ubonensis TaxID=101571 RepID=A0ABD4DW06_9BURK|nr:ABC transporter ATP-binding protein [Burkholderia ubonensis]KVH70723.1 ABC transporter [Burkholderia ubonensis]KVM03269.1 ABC transporter [Burkholderia ubonensis]KVM21044.1 ABC transporter [Burkholderia ubonensis]KVM45494.1 ABC transporter [Burkholderia ubonensis]KVN76161.1 ABC transporter [Burkholderia ubonensis]
MATVETRSLTKRFDDTIAVDGIDLSVREGEFLVLLGPSGSGKTTLLRMIAGLEAPTSGDVLVGGRIVTRLPPRAHNMAMVFQSYALYPHLTVAGNIAFPLEARHTAHETVANKVEWAAALFGIDHLLTRKPRELSGGERQRVALARAVVRDPATFLLDEPLSNLDAKLRASARDELKQVQRRLGTTTIYVTHDQTEALALGDRVAVLDHGRMHQLDTPQQVYLHPADRFVATFIGLPPMNLIAGDDVETGFRPEHFLPQEFFDDDAQLERLPVSITRIEYLGADRLVYGLLEPPQPPVKVISRIPCTASMALQPGTRHLFAVRRADLCRFDARSGASLDTVTDAP